MIFYDLMYIFPLFYFNKVIGNDNCELRCGRFYSLKQNGKNSERDNSEFAEYQKMFAGIL